MERKNRVKGRSEEKGADDVQPSLGAKGPAGKGPGREGGLAMESETTGC